MNTKKIGTISSKNKKTVIIITVSLIFSSIALSIIYGFNYGKYHHNSIHYLSAPGETPPNYHQTNLHSDKHKNDEEISYHMVSTGNGLASFLTFSHSDKAIIFDTGIGGPPTQWRNKKYQGNMILVDELWKAGVKKIAAIFLSHFHTDHYSNLRTVLNNFPVARVIPNISYDKWEEQFGNDFAEHHIKVEKTVKSNYLVNDIIFKSWSYDALDWMVNLPERKNEQENNKSNMIFFEYFGRKFLISGDAEQKLGEHVINANYIEPVDFYQVAHHGSNNALGSDFIAKIKPQYAYIPGTAAINKKDPWAKFMGAMSHQFPKAATIKTLSKYANDIRMIGEKPVIRDADKITVENETLIFTVKGDGSICESVDDTTVINQ